MSASPHIRDILPAGAAPLVGFASVLRANSFPVSPDQTISFLEATDLLGPRSITDIQRAAVAVFAVPPDRRAEFDALFAAHFYGASMPAGAPDDDDAVQAHEPSGIEIDIEADEANDDPGTDAAVTERLAQRTLAVPPEEALDSFRRTAPSRLPRRRAYRHVPLKGRLLDMRRTLRHAARYGEVLDLKTRRRKERQRRIVLLIDVSGSMQDRTEETLAFGHALVQTAERAEAFTLGTRLTRITPALRNQRRDLALERAGALIADIDGGTRIGDALAAFLAVPRYAGHARGSAVIVLSDGLERGTPDVLVENVHRLARLAWRIDWLSPLHSGEMVPQTQALAAIQPHLDAIADGSTISAICSHVLDLQRRAS